MPEVINIPIRQQITAALAATFLLLIIIDLVRRRRLREEYAWLWLCLTVTMLAFTLHLNWLIQLTHMMGARVASSGVYFLGIFFLVLICLHFSIKSSQLTERLKTLAQRTALVEAELNEYLQRNTDLPGLVRSHGRQRSSPG